MQIKMSSKGQIVIPVHMRRMLRLTPDSQLSIDLIDKKLVIRELTTEELWQEAFKNLSTETVALSEQGELSAERAPKFHQWMEEG